MVYRGRGVECPCCGGRFRAFKPVRGRPGAECPGCGAYERHRVLALFLQNELELGGARLDVLHFAAEPPLAQWFRALPNLRYATADIEPEPGALAVDITAITFADMSFDFVFCSHVLEHVPDDDRALRELHRILRPGGRAVLQHPIDYARATTYEDPSIDSPEGRARAFGQEDHVRVYGRDFAERVRSAGFSVDVEPYARKLGAAARSRYGLEMSAPGAYSGSDIYLCERS